MTANAHQPPQIIRVNGIDICYDVFGDGNAEPLLLIMGLGAQMIIKGTGSPMSQPRTTSSAKRSPRAAFA